MFCERKVQLTSLLKCQFIGSSKDFHVFIGYFKEECQFKLVCTVTERIGALTGAHQVLWHHNLFGLNVLLK